MSPDHFQTQIISSSLQKNNIFKKIKQKTFFIQKNLYNFAKQNQKKTKFL